MSAARNLGLERATGDYILFVYADDYIDAEMLYKVLLEANDFDIISFSYSIDFLDDKGELRNYQICNLPFYSYRETSDIYNTLFASQIGIGEKDLVRWARGGRLKENKLKGFTWCYLINRSIVEKNSIRFRTNIIYNEDAIFNIEVFEYAKTAESKGFKVIIAGAGMAAHLPGMCAAIFPMPVIGIPMHTTSLGGRDSLYSIVQMPTDRKSTL